MWSGVSVKDFWRLTPGEIINASKVKQDKYLDFIKTLAWLFYNGAALVSVGVNDPKKFPDLYGAFPSLFSEKEPQNWKVMKQRIEDYASNKKAH